MRLFSKFHIVCTFTVVSILLSALYLGSQRFYYRRVGVPNQQALKFQPTQSFDLRLVVFGDSWSDNNAKEFQAITFACHQENLAQTAKALDGSYIGSVVDNAELSSSTLSLYRAPLADFRAQAAQWLAAEAEIIANMDEDALHERRNRTLVVVSFGVWDLWNAIGQDYDHAAASINHSIEVIMQQLESLAQSWGNDELKMIMTLAPDVTFLPAFRPLGDQRVSQHKSAVRLVEYWNRQLRTLAEKWKKATVYMFDTNAFLADLIRDRQLYEAGMEEEEEANGLGKNQDPGWKNVEDVCVENSEQSVVTSAMKPCPSPEKYLFWNQMHLGQSAHRLMGTEVFHGIEEMWLQ